MKAGAALLIALADIGGVWPVARVTRRSPMSPRPRSARQSIICSGRRVRVRQARTARHKPSGAGFRLHRAGDGEDGGLRAEFLQRYRPDGVFRSRGVGKLTPGVEPTGFYVRLTRELVKLLQERTAGRLRISRRSAAAPRSILDPDCDLNRGGARLLRKPGPELGARRADQGAAVRRRSRGRRQVYPRAVAVRLAQISRLRRRRRRARDEAADPRLSRPRRDRGRGP